MEIFITDMKLEDDEIQEEIVEEFRIKNNRMNSGL
jgi:hypothetical protein